MPSVSTNPLPPGWEQVDRRARKVRADVCAAIPLIWEKANKRAQTVLGKKAEVAELLRFAAIQVSRYLERTGAPPASRDTERLLLICFQRRLRSRLQALVRQWTEDADGAINKDSPAQQPDSSLRLPAQQRTQRTRWSAKANELVIANRKARGAELRKLTAKLVEETGNTRQACWRFLRRLGLPAQRSYKAWTDSQRQHLLNLIELHPVAEVARILNRSQNSVRAMLKRLGGNASMGKDWFSKYTLAEALHVSPGKVQQWIDRGWLKVRTLDAGKGQRTVVDADEFCRFCKTHRAAIIGNRLHRDRLEFVLNFVFPPAHAELLPVRTPYGPRASKQQETCDMAESGATERDDDIA